MNTNPENTPRHAIRFLLQHMMFGTLGGFLFGGLVLYFDLAGLGTLVLESSDRGLAIFLLFFGLFVTFGSMGMGWAIWNLAEERD